MYAILDTDGFRLVVWGLGSTPEAARADAHEQEGYGATKWNRCVEISAARAERIRQGDVDAEDL